MPRCSPVILLTCSLAIGLGCAKDPPPDPFGVPGAGSPDGGTDPATAPKVGTIVLSGVGAHDMPAFALGQNYWNWEPVWGSATTGTESLVKAAGTKLVRAGGFNNDVQTPGAFDNTQLDRFAAYCKTAGAQPLLQVPLINNTAVVRATPADAAAMVTYANVTMGYGIKYWSIGNEPDLYTTQTQTGMPATYSATDYCTSFRQFATAMKTADPSIKILGPELSWKYIPGNDWLTPFLDGCKDVVDVVSVHRYGFAPNLTTVAAAFGDAATFRQTVHALRANLDQHGMTAVPLAITEEHITYDGTPNLSTMPASPQTFYAGMWAADVLGVAIEEGLWTSAFWHIADTTSGWKLAFILGTSPMPTYHATSLLATNMSAKVLKPTGVPAGFSVYASRDDGAGKTVAIVLNKTASAARLGFTFDAAPAQELGFPAASLTAVIFADGGAAPQVLRYTKDLADAGLPPTAVP